MTKIFGLPILFLVGFLVNIYVVENSVQIPKSELKNRPSSLISVSTSLGTLVGYKQKVSHEKLVDKEINVFYGVPYAEPPINDLRFKRAKLVEKFPGNYYQATELKPHCWVTDVQSNNKNDTYSEDCLYANIWTPNLELIKQNDVCSKKFAVIFYVVGGGNSNQRMYPFLDQNGDSHLIYNGEYITALHDIIVVTANYRSKMFASLYVEGEYSGNLAILDQDAILRFVNKYIGDLCGDKDRVTVVTSSVSGSYVSYLLTNKESSKLIKRGILMSLPFVFTHLAPVTKNELMLDSFFVINKVGCLNLKADNISRNVRSLDGKIRTKYFRQINGEFLIKEKLFLNELDKNILKLKEYSGKLRKEITYLDLDYYLDKDMVKLVSFLSKYTVDFECLKNFDPKLLNARDIYNEEVYEMHYDNDLIDEQTFLDYRLFNKLDINPNISLLIGLTKDEMLKDVVDIKGNYYSDRYTAPVISKEEAKRLIKEFNGLKVDGESDESFASLTADYYTENKWELSRGYLDSYVNIINDQWFLCPNYFYSYYAAMEVNVFNYIMTYKATKHFSSHLLERDLKDLTYAGPMHTDEIIYLFALPFRLPNHFTDFDRKYSLKLMDIYASFARDGSLPALSNKEPWPVANKYNPQPRYTEVSGSYTRERKFEFEERCEEFYRPLLPFYKR